MGIFCFTLSAPLYRKHHADKQVRWWAGGGFDSCLSSSPPAQNHFKENAEMEHAIIRELGLKYETPLAALTLGQFMEVLASVDKGTPVQDPERQFVYGLRGIELLFGVSHKTAQAWKNTWLAPACSQLGRVIMVDRDKAIELFEATGRAKMDCYGL